MPGGMNVCRARALTKRTDLTREKIHGPDHHSVGTLQRHVVARGVPR